MILLLSTSRIPDGQDTSKFEWALENIEWINLNIPILIDKVSLITAATVLFISANVLMFSNRYMVYEKEKSTFLLIILLFITSILILIFVPHIVFLLMGWDGLGLVRFLLVIHYPTPQALRSGYITVLTNRIGDCLIILTIPLIASSLSIVPSLYHNRLFTIGVVLILSSAAITKRAQIPFSSWLPAAIAAPTPISALVHSSTLVTAGVYLIYRFYPLLESARVFSLYLLLFSSMTILMAGYGAVKEIDIKKVIALSTLSQLGVMMYSLRMGIPELAIFHLITHATFKALLFIGAGNFILQMSHTQDLRQLGLTYTERPLTFSAITVANISLIAFPFMAGFFSKDLIIEKSIDQHLTIGIFIIIALSTALTVTYSIRFSFWLFGSRKNGAGMCNVFQRDKNLNRAILILIVYVLIRGALMRWGLCFPYLHPNLEEVIKYSILTLVAGTTILTVLSNRLPFNLKPSYFTRTIWIINVVNSQALISYTYPIINKVFMVGDSSWNETFLGRGVIKSVRGILTGFFSLQFYIHVASFSILLYMWLTHI